MQLATGMQELRPRSDNAGRMAGMQCSQELWQANSQALIPLIGITPDSILFMANAYIYILHVTVVFHLPPSLFGFLCNCSTNYLFIYLQYIIPTDYTLTNMTLEIEASIRQLFVQIDRIMILLALME